MAVKMVTDQIDEGKRGKFIIVRRQFVLRPSSVEPRYDARQAFGQPIEITRHRRML